MNRLLSSLLILGLTALAEAGGAKPNASFEADANRALDELAVLCAAEGGRIWGQSLCGPTLVVDPQSRAYVARDLAGSLAEDGILNSDVPIANTAIEWRGRRWAMILWPLPDDEAERDRLMLHESWHRLQPDLGLTGTDRPRDHLDTSEGRTSLRLELRALRSALTASSRSETQRASCWAVGIRAARYRNFAGAQAGEAALEANEGLAEYTGWAAAAPIDRHEMASAINRREADRSHGRSFAYLTGPAYGVLLDRLRPDWRSKFKDGSDLGSLLAEALPASCQGDRGREAAMMALGETLVRAEESALAADRETQLSTWRAALVEGPVVILPMTDAQIVFDPANVFALPPHGNVYPKASVTASWGRLQVSSGALVATDWSTVTVSGGSVQSGGRVARGPGWMIDLSPDWMLEREGTRWIIAQSASSETTRTPE